MFFVNMPKKKTISIESSPKRKTDYMQKGSNNAIIIDVLNSRIAARWHVDRVAVYSTPHHYDCPLLHGQEMIAIKFYYQ